ncbi:MAG: hypothetical protein C0465_26315 [Ralstonia sp.]|uniref:hypothetical protein n=1 Tax=Ralstonia sp. TaxID=54061 RepID=UPI00257F3808|nr:hypothetical protein [Ralstonia sp.]MBA4234090.1 hypothetical protein [Ralstonia sp.]
MQKLNIKLTTAVRNTPKDVPAPGHEHHTNIDVAGTGSDDFNFPSTEDLVKRSLKRAAREAKNQRKRDRKAGKSVTQPQGDSDNTGSDGQDDGKSLIGDLVIPQVAKVVPAGQTRETYTDGQTILQGADGFQAMMIARQFDGYYEERFGDMASLFTWGIANMEAKYKPVVISLDRQLGKLRTSYEKALPQLVADLAKRNPKAPIMAVMQKAVQLIDKELMQILYVLNVYAESIKQGRDGRFTSELGAVAVFFEDAFNLYTAGDMHCTADGSKLPQQLPMDNYSVGDVFMPRVTASGLATIPGARGPVGANALQVPFEMLDILMLVLPLLGHEARHNVYHDVKGLEEESLEVVEKAIRDAHTAGTIKFAADEMEVNGDKVPTIEMVVKLFCEWLGEIDADVVGGVLFSGEAFGDNMIMSFPAMMVRSGKVSSKENLLRNESRYHLVPQKDGSVGLVFEEHPVDFVRVKLVAATLEEIGFAKAGTRLRELADFMVGDVIPTEVIYKDAEGKEDLVIKFNTADLVAVGPVVAKALIRTPMKSLSGKSNGDLVMWNSHRQAKVEAIAAILEKGSSELPNDQGSIFATYVGSAATNAYLRLVASKVDPVTAARTVNVNALKMVAGLRSLTCNQCPVPVTVVAPVATVVAEPAVQTVVAETATAEADPAPAGEVKADVETPVAPAATSGETK